MKKAKRIFYDAKGFLEKLPKKGLAMILAVLMISGVLELGIGGLLSVIAEADNENIIVAVPETIYLNPSDKKSFQYFINNEIINNALSLKAERAQGNGYFYLKGAGSSSISGVTVTLGSGTASIGTQTLVTNANPGASRYDGSITSGLSLSSPINSGESKTLKWTITYTAASTGESHTTYAYTTVYAPCLDTVAAISAGNVQEASIGDTAVWTAIFGIHEIVTSSMGAVTLSGTGGFYHGSSVDATCTYKYNLTNHNQENTPANYHGGEAPSTSNILAASGNGGCAYWYKGWNNGTDGRDVSGGKGRIYYDSSRQTKLEQIPNFYVHSYCGDFRQDGTWDYTENVSNDQGWYMANSSKAIQQYATYGQVVTKNKDGIVTKITDPALTDINLGNGYVFYNRIHRTWRQRNGIGSHETVDIRALVGCEFIDVNKSELRDMVQSAIGGNYSAADWAKLDRAFGNASLVLGQPDATAAECKNAKDSLAASLASLIGSYPEYKIEFIVPEAIYLNPTDSTTALNTFQYYLNNKAENGSVVADGTYVGSDPGGYVSFRCTDSSTTPTSVTITCDAATVNGVSANTAVFSGTSSVSRRITSGSLASNLSFGGTRTLTWTAKYTIDGKEFTAKNYTVCYAPYLGSVAAAAMGKGDACNNDDDSKNVSAVSLIYGIHNIKTNAALGASYTYGSTSVTIAGSAENGNFIGTVGNWGSYPLVTAPAAYRWNTHNNPTYFSSGVFNDGSTKYGMASTYRKGDTGGRETASGVGYIAADSSRQSTFADIPNFNIFYNVAADKSSISYRVDMLTKVAGGAAYTDSASTNIANTTVSGNYTGAVGTATALANVAITNGAVILKTYANRDSTATAYAVCEVGYVSKADMREEYYEAINSGRQADWYTADSWEEYEDALETVGTRLGTVSSTVIGTSEISEAISKLTFKTGNLRVRDVSTTGKVLEDYGNQTYNYGEDKTVSTTSEGYEGYTYKGYAENKNIFDFDSAGFPDNGYNVSDIDVSEYNTVAFKITGENAYMNQCADVIELESGATYKLDYDFTCSDSNGTTRFTIFTSPDKSSGFSTTSWVDRTNYYENVSPGSTFTVFSGRPYVKIRLGVSNTSTAGTEVSYSNISMVKVGGGTTTNNASKKELTYTNICDPGTDVDFRYEPISYGITYNYNGGTVATANPTSYNIETPSFTLNNPTKEGHIFLGWTGTDLSGLEENVTISQGSVGAKTYTANWRAFPLDITYDEQFDMAKFRAAYIKGETASDTACGGTVNGTTESVSFSENVLNITSYPNPNSNKLTSTNVGYKIPVEAGKEYKFSFEMKCDEEWKYFTPLVTFWDENGSSINMDGADGYIYDDTFLNMCVPSNEEHEWYVESDQKNTAILVYNDGGEFYQWNPHTSAANVFGKANESINCGSANADLFPTSDGYGMEYWYFIAPAGAKYVTVNFGDGGTSNDSQPHTAHFRNVSLKRVEHYAVGAGEYRSVSESEMNYNPQTQNYSFYKPEKDGYDFSKWVYEGTSTQFNTSVLATDTDGVSLSSVWTVHGGSGVNIATNNGNPQNNLIYFTNGANSASFNTTVPKDDGAYSTFFSGYAEYDAENEITITGQRGQFKNSSGELRSADAETTYDFVNKAMVKLKKGATYRLTFESTNKNTEAFFIEVKNNKADYNNRTGGLSSYTKVGDYFSYSNEFTVGGANWSVGTGVTVPDEAYYCLRIDQNSYSDSDGKFKITNLKLVEITDSTTEVNHIDAPSGVTRYIEQPTRADGVPFKEWELTGTNPGSIDGNTYTFGTGEGTLTAKWNRYVVYDNLFDFYAWKKNTNSSTIGGKTTSGDKCIVNEDAKSIEVIDDGVAKEDSYDIYTGYGSTSYTMPVEVGKKYKISFHVDCNSAGYRWIPFWFDGGSAKVYDGAAYTGSSSKNVEFTFTALSDKLSIRFGVNNPGADAVYSNIRVVPVEIYGETNFGTEWKTEGEAIGTMLSQPESIKGRSFAGWYTQPNGGGSQVLSTTTVNTDLNLWSKWSLIDYTITYKDGDTVLTTTGNPTGYNVDSETITLASIPKTGYTFNGWNLTTDGAFPDGATTAAKASDVPAGTYGNITATADWTANTYTVTYKNAAADNGVIPGSLPSAQSYNIASTSTVAGMSATGYTFDGWTVEATSGSWTKDNVISAGTSLNGKHGDVTLVAKWTANSDTPYKVEHYVMRTNGSYPTSATSTTDSAITVGTTGATLTLANLSLEVPNGIEYSYGTVGESTVESTTIAADGLMVIKLYYVRKQYTLTLNAGTGISAVTRDGISAVTVAGTYYYEQGASIDATVKPGYTWSKWSDNYTGKSIEISMPAANTTLTATATPNEYTVTLNGNGGSGGTASVTATYDAAMPTPITKPSKTGYTFAGYYDTDAATGGNQYYDKDGNSARKWDKTSTATLYARWTANTITVQYANGGGSGTAPANGSFSYGSSFTPAANTFTAPAGYTVTFSTDGGDAVSPVTSTKSFDKWMSNKNSTAYAAGTAVNDNLGATSGTVTLTAQWKNNSITLPSATKTGYTFAGWFTDSGLTQSAGAAGASYTPAEAKTLYAKWTENTYTIEFNNNDGSGTMTSITGVKYTEEKALTANTFTKTGYDFDGWSTTKGGAKVYADKATVSKLSETNGATVTLYAVWKQGTYTITYNYNGGTVATANPADYNVESNDITLSEPTKSGYTFIGWTGSNGTTPATPLTIAKGSTGNRTYTANWVKSDIAIGGYDKINLLNGISGLTATAIDKTGTNGKIVLDASGNLTFTPKNTNWTAAEEFNVSLSNGVTVSMNLYPQTNVLYEEDALAFTNSTKPIGTNGIWDASAQSAKSTGTTSSSNAYGYLSTYEKDIGYSGGTAKRVTVSQGSGNAMCEFTFTGTTFDIISTCDNRSGVMVVRVLNPSTGKAIGMNKIVDTFYSGNALYQVPVFHWENSTYGTYKVQIGVSFNETFDHTGSNNSSANKVVFENGSVVDLSEYFGEEFKECEYYSVNDMYPAPQSEIADLEPVTVKGSGSYDVTIDAVRIYNPNLEGTVYTADKEIAPTYIRMNKLLTGGDDNTAFFADVATYDTKLGEYAYKDWAKYNHYSPNNEIYIPKKEVSTGKLGTLVFGIDNFNKSTSKVHISLRAPLGGTAEVTVSDGESNICQIQTCSATEMYFEIPVNCIKDLGSGKGSIYISATSAEATVSICSIKLINAMPDASFSSSSTQKLSPRLLTSLLNEPELENMTFPVSFGEAGSDNITVAKENLAKALVESVWTATGTLNEQQLGDVLAKAGLDKAYKLTVSSANITAKYIDGKWVTDTVNVTVEEIIPEAEETMTFTVDFGEYGSADIDISKSNIKVEKIKGVWTASAEITKEQLNALLEKAGINETYKLSSENGITLTAKYVDGKWVNDAANVTVEEIIPETEETVTFTVNFGEYGSADIDISKSNIKVEKIKGVWTASAEITKEQLNALLEKAGINETYKLSSENGITLTAKYIEDKWVTDTANVTVEEIVPEVEETMTFTVDFGEYGSADIEISKNDIKVEKIDGVWVATVTVTNEELAELLEKAGIADKCELDSEDGITLTAKRVGDEWQTESATAEVKEKEPEPEELSWFRKLIRAIVSFFRMIADFFKMIFKA